MGSLSKLHVNNSRPARFQRLARKWSYQCANQRETRETPELGLSRNNSASTYSEFNWSHCFRSFIDDIREITKSEMLNVIVRLFDVNLESDGMNLKCDLSLQWYYHDQCFLLLQRCKATLYCWEGRDNHWYQRRILHRQKIDYFHQNFWYIFIIRK